MDNKVLRTFRVRMQDSSFIVQEKVGSDWKFTGEIPFNGDCCGNVTITLSKEITCLLDGIEFTTCETMLIKELTDKDILLGYFSMSKRTYLSIKRFQDLIIRINFYLRKNEVGVYSQMYSIDPETIKLVILHYSPLFSCDEDLIYFKGNLRDTSLVSNNLSTGILEVIRMFVQETEGELK